MSHIKDIFLKLTEYTIPFKKEKTLEHLLPKGFKIDKIGNYFYEIGNSETLFTTHLDTYSKKYEKVNHIGYLEDGKTASPIEDDNTVIIATDGKTILGGDNKAGCTIMINMINNNIPGAYFFFLGEEPVLSGGVWGSTNALKNNPEYFKKFKRAIAFDRREIGSVITRQMARPCCSNEFTDAMINELNKNGIPSHADPTGYYTDSGVFMDVVPEVTNLSAGVWNEHHLDEYINIKYLEKVAEAALHISWETLPVVRIPKKNVPAKNNTNVITKFNKFDIKQSERSFDAVNDLLEDFGYLCLNSEDFEPEHEMVFSHWHEHDSEISIKFVGTNVIFNDKTYNIEVFLKMLYPEIDLTKYLK